MILDLNNKKRIVIKIGSALLIDDNKIKISWLKTLADDVKKLKELNLEIVIVSSGAIALGRNYLKTKTKLKLAEKQAAAAIGQIELMSQYQNQFVKNNLNIAQILLTGNESNQRDKFLNSRNTFNALLKNNIIPIVNENDSVTTEEIKIGDNDRLAARVAQMIEADLLILFSDVDGLYDKNPKTNPNAKLIKVVEKITKEVEEMASDSISKFGTGGMITKIRAAKMAFNCGCDTIITCGLEKNPISKLVSKNAKYSLFKASKKKISSKKQWIVDSLDLKGQIIINKKAAEALKKGSSLLPVGVKEIIGNFSSGDKVLIKDDNQNHIATGIISYSNLEANLIINKKSSEIKNILGKNSKKELIHRNNMVVII